MVRALVWKEVRSCIPLSVAGLLFMLVFCGQMLSVAPHEPIRIFEDRETMLVLQMATILIGACLGLWQTLPESATGTAAFLVHTARNRTAILLAKATAGLGLYSLIFVLPLFVTAGLIVARSAYVLPLSWGDTAYLWIILWAGAAAYLASVAVGLRGLPWREGPRQLASTVVFGLGIGLGLQSPFLSWAVALLGATTVVAALWAWTGLRAREF